MRCVCFGVCIIIMYTCVCVCGINGKTTSFNRFKVKTLQLVFIHYVCYIYTMVKWNVSSLQHLEKNSANLSLQCVSAVVGLGVWGCLCCGVHGRCSVVAW